MPVEEEYCLGVEALGRCAVSTEPLFSVGEALVVVALLLGFYHFAGALARLRLRARGWSGKALLLFLGPGVVLSLVAALLRLFGPPWSRVAVVGYPLTWEIAAAVATAAAGIALAIAACTPSRLRPRTAADFLAGNQAIIAGGKPEALRVLGAEIAASVPLVTGRCREYRDREKREGHAEPDAFTRTCFSLLEVWSDPRFCNAIVCWCPETAGTVIRELAGHTAFGDGAPLGSELVNQAFTDERSLLYREARQSGLRRQKLFLKSIFGDWNLIDSDVRPLASWHVFRDPSISERKVQRWSEAVDTALGAFLEKGTHGEAVYRLRQGLETLNHLCDAVLAERERRAAPWSSIHDQLYEIATAFRTIVRRIRTSNLPTPIETTVENYEALQDETLHGAVAEELFHFFGLLCASDDHEFLDWISMGPWKELFEEGELTTNLRALQVRVAHHLTAKVDDNLDPQRRFGPLLTRLLLVRYPFARPDDLPRAAVAGDLQERFVAAVKAQFPALWKANRAYAEKLLPDNAEYDEARSTLHIRQPRRESQTLELVVPAS